MMHFDFWNNPILVSAFRLRFRRANPMHVLVLYPLALLLLGMGVPYFINDPTFTKQWPEYAFYILMALQLVISGIMAGSATSSSLKAEITKQTMDFQRISCLSPRQILLGKLFGESAMAFFLAVSIIPLGVLCLALGGVGPDLLVLAFVNLFSNTLLCGALGLVMQMEMKGNKLEGGGWWALPLVVEMQSLFALKSLAWSWVIEILSVVPVAHLLVAFLAFHVMERRLDNPLKPAVSKRVSYILLVLLDAVAGGWILYRDLSLGRTVAAFCLAHLGLSLVLAFSVTPWRESLKSWVWRFRGRLPWWRDSLLADRSENAMPLLVYCVIGACLFAAVTVSAAYLLRRGGFGDEVGPEWPTVPVVAALTVLLLLVLGTCYQWFMLVFGKGGNGLFVGALGAAIFAPYMTAQGLASTYPERRTERTAHWMGHDPLVDWLLLFSPATHYVQAFSEPTRPLNVVPVLLLYGAFGALAWRSLRKRLAMIAKVVDRKLASMGVPHKGGKEEVLEVLPLAAGGEGTG